MDKQCAQIAITTFADFADVFFAAAGVNLGVRPSQAIWAKYDTSSCREKRGRAQR